MNDKEAPPRFNDVVSSALGENKQPNWVPTRETKGTSLSKGPRKVANPGRKTHRREAR